MRVYQLVSGLVVSGVIVFAGSISLGTNAKNKNKQHYRTAENNNIAGINGVNSLRAKKVSFPGGLNNINHNGKLVLAG